jgi:hypothetical protein
MRNKLIFAFFVLTSLSVSSQTTKKEKPMDFAMKIAKILVNKDCSGYTSYFNDAVVLLRQDTIFLKSEFAEKLQGMCGFAVKSDLVTYDYYLNNFEQEILNYRKIKKNKYLMTAIKANSYYSLGRKDYLFNGFIHKTGNFTDYLLNDPLCFIFRKTEDSYLIVVLADN